MNKSILLDNLDKLHTTEMGADRIKRNLGLKTDDAVGWCKQKIRDVGCRVSRQGKNYYAETADCVITVNANSFTVITAHKI